MQWPASQLGLRAAESAYLVEDQDLAVPDQSSSKSDELSLSLRQVAASSSDLGVETETHRCRSAALAVSNGSESRRVHGVVQFDILVLAEWILKVSVSTRWSVVTYQIEPERSRQKNRVLWDDGDVGSKGFEVDILGLESVDDHTTSSGDHTQYGKRLS
jgi:hypothetical protein